MGISSPSVAFTGYRASADLLIQDIAVYQVNGAWIDATTGSTVSDITKGGKFRFTVSLNHSVIGNKCWFRMKINGVTLWEEEYWHGGNTDYETFTTDLPITWRRGDEILTQISGEGLGWGHQKDFKISGKITPILLN